MKDERWKMKIVERLTSNDIGDIGEMGEIGVSASYNSYNSYNSTEAHPSSTEAHPQTLNKGAAPQFAWRKWGSRSLKSGAKSTRKMSFVTQRNDDRTE